MSLITKLVERNEQDAKMLPIAWVSTSPNSNTGYAIQSREVVGRLRQKGYDITYISGGGKIDWSPDQNNTFTLSDGSTATIPVLPTFGKTSGYDQWENHKEKHGFKLILSLWDSFITQEYMSYHESTNGVFQIPVDTTFTKKMFKMTKYANHLVTMSKYGYEQLLKYFPPRKLSYIPHGIDTNIYRPLHFETNTITRNELGIGDTDYLFITVAANAGMRKKLPDLLNTFRAVLSQGKKSIYLYLFTNMNVPSYVGFDLHSIIEELGIKDNIIIPKTDTFMNPMSIKEMVMLYNAADCYISMSQGEGFGLPVLEAMACGKPVIAPNNSTMPELLDYGNNGWLVNNIPKDVTSDYMFGIPTVQDYPLPDRYLFRKAIVHITNHRDELYDKGEAARDYVLNNYQWEKIIREWENLIQKETEKITIKEQAKTGMR